MKEIDKALVNAESRIYYKFPVWFIDENPIVGYNVSARHVMLLFWSGQSFKTPGLIAAGKFKAAKITYQDPDDMDTLKLRQWLKEARSIQWDYKNIRKTGDLARVSGKK
jgi:hypothetical protein